ncbi:MAG: YifB family Mg chelatase-like AAA ATPase [Ruminococcus sp.]|nr:YifB family Mg chelatase-like AAA ATPase [Ruminococcus sp.]
MSFSTILTASVLGMKVEFVQVEADVSNGLPAFHMVGYLSSEVKEAAERVQTAIRNAGFDYPPKKTVINLSPAAVRKRGASFDLPIAVSILVSLGKIARKSTEKMLIIGELSLDGRIRGVQGILPIVLAAREEGIKTCLIPRENVSEGTLAEGVEIVGADSLKEAAAWLNGEKSAIETAVKTKMQFAAKEEEELDYADICGQAAVKRAIEIAVAGGHNLLMVGPPGSGKTMAAKRIPTIFPALTEEESMELTKIYSVLGMLDKKQPLIQKRPFRSVHHTATRTALTGGGRMPLPGEISLAHRGVLFLDELPEFQKNVIESLRQPLEEKKIRITRTHGNYVFPADFMLVAAMNPCPCGCYPDMNRCTCTPSQIHNYMAKLSRPFLDRIDICVEASRVEYEDLKNAARKEQDKSEAIRERICKVRNIQKERYINDVWTTNAMLDIKGLEKYCRLGDAEEQLLKQAFTNLGLTARSYHKILKVARTIADLDESEEITIEHLAEAIGYRIFDKGMQR